MNNFQIQSPNVMGVLFDFLNKAAVIEVKPVVSTIDGDIISQNAMNDAVKNGKGLMIGDFFVGSANSSEPEFGYSL